MFTVPDADGQMTVENPKLEAYKYIALVKGWSPEATYTLTEEDGVYTVEFVGLMPAIYAPLTLEVQ